MRREIIERIEWYAKEQKMEGPIIDIGGCHEDYQKAQGYHWRSFFQNCGYNYQLLDKNAGKGVDLVLDATELPKTMAEKYNTVLCTGMLEHCLDFWAVIKECKRILKPGGLLFVSTPHFYVVHSPEDYWRFTEKGTRLLVADMELVEFKLMGEPEKQNVEYLIIGRKNK